MKTYNESYGIFSAQVNVGANHSFLNSSKILDISNNAHVSHTTLIISENDGWQKLLHRTAYKCIFAQYHVSDLDYFVVVCFSVHCKNSSSRALTEDN